MKSALIVFLFAAQVFAFELPKEEILLSSIRSSIPTPVLSVDEQTLTLKQTGLIFEQIYTHTDLKIDFFHNTGLDPVVRTAALSPLLPENSLDFLAQVARITLDLRDPHQSYQMPRPYSCLRTFVPMEMGFASYVPMDQKVVVKSINVDGLKNKDVKKLMASTLANINVGDIVTMIDGVEIGSALNTAAIYGSGSNDDAHLYEGLFMLTYISQRNRALPQNDVMRITLQTAAGEKIIEIPYLVRTSSSCESEQKMKSRPLFFREGSRFKISRAHPMAADFKRDSARKKTRLQLLNMNFGNYQKSAEPTVGSALIDLNGHQYGYLRIEEFTPETEIATAEEEILRIVKDFDLTTAGLIIDVRGNPGGEYGDYLTQYFSKIPVVSQVEEIRASELNEMILEKMKGSTDDEWLMSYLEYVKKGRAEGRKFTERLPINKPEYLNEKGRQYHQPVILLADPSCYSYCDYFSTSMQDHEAAEVWIENGEHTGGGGATVSSYEAFSFLFPQMIPALPQQQDMGVAYSTGYRTGKKAGVSIENLGADADHVYHTTINDVKKNDVDLLQALDNRFQKMKAKY